MSRPKSDLDQRIIASQLYLSRQALANPEHDENYRAVIDARQAVTDAQRALTKAESKWAAIIKPAMDERHKKSGHCDANREGDCFSAHCPQLRDGEPAKTGRSCPLPSLGDEDM